MSTLGPRPRLVKALPESDASVTLQRVEPLAAFHPDDVVTELEDGRQYRRVRSSASSRRPDAQDSFALKPSNSALASYCLVRVTILTLPEV